MDNILRAFLQEIADDFGMEGSELEDAESLLYDVMQDIESEEDADRVERYMRDFARYRHAGL